MPINSTTAPLAEPAAADRSRDDDGAGAATVVTLAGGDAIDLYEVIAEMDGGPGEPDIDLLATGRPPPRPPPAPLRGRVKRAIQRRAPDADLTVTDGGPDFIGFRIVQGQWITTETYRVHLDDDADDIGEIVARALRDLERDMAAYPAV